MLVPLSMLPMLLPMLLLLMLMLMLLLLMLPLMLLMLSIMLLGLLVRSPTTLEQNKTHTSKPCFWLLWRRGISYETRITDRKMKLQTTPAQPDTKRLIFKPSSIAPWFVEAHFAYDPALKNFVKGLCYDPTAVILSNWVKAKKCWLVPIEMVEIVAAEARRLGFTC